MSLSSKTQIKPTKKGPIFFLSFHGKWNKTKQSMFVCAYVFEHFCDNILLFLWMQWTQIKIKVFVNGCQLLRCTKMSKAESIINNNSWKTQTKNQKKKKSNTKSLREHLMLLCSKYNGNHNAKLIKAANTYTLIKVSNRHMHLVFNAIDLSLCGDYYGDSNSTKWEKIVRNTKKKERANKCKKKTQQRNYRSISLLNSASIVLQ